MSPQQTIAHYRIIAKLGEGGMGAVYRATDTKLGRDVAIKVLPEAFSREPERMARFAREAQLLAALNHPNVAAIYGIEQKAIVMELVEGEDLHGPVPADQALPIIQQMIDALEYAHEKGIVHRDLKPANIKVTPEHRVKVLDFGLAKAMIGDSPAADTANSPTLTIAATMAGAIMGTAAYMAPEQARGQKVDKRADIWAFGVVVYEMLTGRRLFEADNVSDILVQVLTKEPDFATVPPRFRPLLRRCLERDPRKRLRDIGDARAALLEESGHSIAAVAAAPRPWPWMVAALGLAIAATGFAGLWLSTNSRPAPLYHFEVESARSQLSPNGRWMVIWGRGQRGLGVRSMDDPEVRMLPGTEAGEDPFWSPDSSTIGYFSDGQLCSISVQGTNDKVLAPAPDPAGATWRGGTSDGTILFASARRLHALDLATRKVRELPLNIPEGERALQPVFLPEGDGFVYLLGPVNAPQLFQSSLSASVAGGRFPLDTRRRVEFARHPHTGQWHVFYMGSDDLALYARPIDPSTASLSGTPVRLLDQVSRAANSGRAAFQVAEGGVIAWRNPSQALPIWRLRWYGADGRIIGNLGEAGTYSSLALSPDESKVAVIQGYPVERLWLINVEGGGGAMLGVMPGRQDNPIWSVDGRALYYTVASETGSRVLRQQPAPGTAPEVLLDDAPGTLKLQDITADGRYLLMIRSVTGHEPGIYRLDVSGSARARTPEILVANRTVAFARFGPGYKAILFEADNGIFAQLYPTSNEPKVQIAPNYRASFFLSANRRTLFMGEGGFLWSMPVLDDAGGRLKLGERKSVFQLTTTTRAYVNNGAQARDGRLLVIASDSDAAGLRSHILSDWTSLIKR